jgi:molybdenum cofactor cytidylyltransferase
VAVPTDSIGVILLAAGASARMGEPKQLLKFQGETLLRRAAKVALAASRKVVVTLGSRIKIMRKEVEDLPVEIVENENWATGMSGSIRVGLKKLIADDQLKAVILMVCDQPFVDETLLEKLTAGFHETDALIVACAYRNTLGVPALFHRRLFPELLALDTPTGAKHLIQKYAGQAETISFPEGAFDVDTPADYENLMKKIR